MKLATRQPYSSRSNSASKAFVALMRHLEGPVLQRLTLKLRSACSEPILALCDQITIGAFPSLEEIDGSILVPGTGIESSCDGMAHASWQDLTSLCKAREIRLDQLVQEKASRWNGIQWSF